MSVTKAGRPTVDLGNLDGDDRERASAYNAGGFTAVLELARARQAKLRRELTALLDGLTEDELHELFERLMPPFSPTFEPSPLEIQVHRVRRELGAWHSVETEAQAHAANEAHGWTILPDGTPLKMLPDGRVLSSSSSVRYEEPDGTIVDTTPGPVERRRHRRLAQQFATRVRGERLARARRVSAFAPRRVRPLARRRGAGRPRAQVTRSSARSGDGPSASDSHEPDAAPHRPAGRRAVGIPETVHRYVAALDLTIDLVRWCNRCAVVAPVIDSYQCDALDRVGFHDICPDCGRAS